MKLTSTLAGLLLFVLSAPVRAGLYSDDMAKCLVASTSDKDKTELVRWIFANAALHPDVASIASISNDQRAALNRATADLLERLLTVTCRKQTKEALKYEGPIAIQLSFRVLGQVAGQALMSNPAVAKGFGEVNRLLDVEKLKELSNSPD